ncbi:MAG TPA: prolyl oligopeptidase family serine peptidase, partial [Acidimicrobiales bacterium]|nr:prolyl oligopeptidase family serine peptidase [Acidimicrobiales bacterium]
MGTAPYGTWRSRLAAAHLVEQAVGLGHVATACGDVYWSEARPSESGREVIVRRGREGAHHDVVPAGFSARSTVHEYGGRCYTVVRASLWFANADDQRLYRCPAEPGAAATAVTPPPATPRGVRFADLSSTPDERWVLAVRETHGGGEPANDLVALPVDAGEGRVHTVAGGHDFVAAPRVSPDGSQLAWLSWDHPNMPWDGTELWVAPFGPDARVGAARLVAGGRAESISQPRWSPDGRLHFLSDRNGWWNLYVDDGRGGRPLAPRAAELCGPDWALGESSYVFLPDGRLVATWSSGGFAHLGVLEGDELVEVPTPYCAFSSLAALDGGVAAVAGSPTEEPAVVRIDVASGSAEVLRRSRPPILDPGDVSAPVAIEFPSEGGRTAHALFYRPAHRDTTGPDGERPPLVVTCHGGPTGAASPVLDLGVQFWTNRGLAVAAVDYGGSAGYGRPYRELLRGAWGIVDVDDCV